MGLIEPDFRDRVRYTLRHREYGSLVIPEPEGWENDDKEIARHEDYHGMFTKFSNSLKFVLDGADYITTVFEIWGVNANIQLIKEERNFETDIWERIYDGFLDLSTYEVEDRQVSVKFNNSGLEEILKARESENVEIERLDDLDGNTILPLETKTVALKGRRIFLKSIWDIKQANNNAYLYNQTNGQTRGKTVGVPLNLAIRSHENAQSVIPNTTFGDDTHDRSGNGTTGVMFYASSDRVRSIRVKFTISFTMKVLQYDDLNWSKYWLRLATYKNGADYNYKSAVNLWFVDGHNLVNYNNQRLTFSFDQVINIGIGESLSLQFCQLMDGKIAASAHLETDCRDIVCDLTMEEDSFFEQTSSKFVLAHTLGKRLVQIITGRENAFYSKVLGNPDLGYNSEGEASRIGFAHGMWIRGFDKYPETEENKYKPFTTNFKDFRKSMETIWNLGMGVERIGFMERIRMEPLNYFYQSRVAVRLPYQIKKVKRSVADKEYYSSVEIGYEKGGDYQEAMGLDEYNAKSNFTTVITRIKNVYAQLSKYRADSYGKEFARRKPKSNFPTEDTDYDKDIFVMDLKKKFGSYEERLWHDNFAQPPTGVFSPETATNLRLSPFNLMLRHGWRIAAGLSKYLTDYVRYGSSTANSKLTTKRIGGNQYAENGNIINSELGRPRFVPMYIECEHLVDSALMRQIEGHTEIDGQKVPNYYCLFEFTNENNEMERGYLVNLKPNGEGKWKFIKSYR